MFYLTIIFRMHEEKGGNYSFDFNPYNSYPIIRMGYMRSKIQNHLTTVQAKLNNMKLLRLQGIKDDPNKNKSFRLKKFVISHTYQKEYIKALEEALHWMKNDFVSLPRDTHRSCNRRKHARI
jgi:hypothetical protein